MHEAEMPENAPAKPTAAAARDKPPQLNFKPGSAGFEWLGRSTETWLFPSWAKGSARRA